MLYTFCMLGGLATLLLMLLRISRGFRNPQLPYVRRTRTLAYLYSATATVKAPHATYLVFPAPATHPHMLDVVPTVLRDFTEELLGKDAEPVHVERVKNVDSEQRLAVSHVGGDVSRRRPCVTFNIQPISQASPPPIPGPSREDAFSNIAHHENASLAGPSGIKRTPSPSPSDASATPRSRSSSLSAISTCPNSPTATHSANSSTTPSGNLLKTYSSLDPTAYLTREERTAAASEGADGAPFKVYWWETRSTERISCPPNISTRRELAEGDIFLHRWGSWLNNGGEHVQMWIWIAEDGRPWRWKSVHVGYTRSDGRVLCLTEKRKLPSWLERSWFMKRRAQNRV